MRERMLCVRANLGGGRNEKGRGKPGKENHGPSADHATVTLRWEREARTLDGSTHALARLWPPAGTAGHQQCVCR
jgi:hypothetical protein